MPSCQIASLFFISLLYAFLPSTDGNCPTGKIDGYAFCCCKKIYSTTQVATTTTTPLSSIEASTSVMPSTSTASHNTSDFSTPINTTPTSSHSEAVSSTSAVVSNIASSSTPIATVSTTGHTATSPVLSSSVTPLSSTGSISTSAYVSSSLLPTPTPIYRGDGCFVTEQKYGYYNECYCNHTRYKYEGFNNSNGFYTDNPNATSYEYKCWNLPKPKLYIGGLIETKSELGKKMLIAAGLALEEINKNDMVLPGYELVLLQQNSTMHWISTGSGVLLDYLNQEPKKVALLGPDDNDLAKTVGAIASLPRYKLLQISYGTNAIELSLDHSTFYPYFFRTKPFYDLIYNKVKVAMLQMYSWSKVGLLYTNDVYYSQLNGNLRTQLQTAKIPIAIEEEFVTDPYSALEHFQRKDVHVILGSFSGADASRVLCAAYKLKMYGPLYVYLFVGYTYLSAVDGCTVEQIRCAARYQFFFGSNIQRCQHHFVSNYTERLNNTFFNTSINPTPHSNQLSYGQYIYDAVYVIANVLHAVDTNKGNSSRFWLSYVYGSDLYGKKLRDKVIGYNQCGASGMVSFDSEGNRHFPVSIIQMRFGGGDMIVGSFDNNRSTNKLQMPFVKWPGNNIPYKEVTRVNYWRFVSKGLYIAYCVFAGLGIIFALFCLFVLIWRRKHKEIRHSFYPLNIVIIIGCILVYVSVFLFGVDNIISPVLTVDRICRARLWVFSLGFVLVVGSLIAKLWLVQDVLSRRILMEKKRRCRIMFGIVFACLLITIIILVCWHTLNPLKRVIEYIRDEVKFYCDTDIWPDNPFSIKITAVEQCKCDNEVVWYFVTIIWKALLLLVSVYWAYQTRDVFIPTINDTQRCGLCSYIIAGCCVVGLIIALTTRLLPDVFFGLVGLIIIACVTAVLIILFLHKILLVFSCSRDRVIAKSATEEEDDINCFSRCLSKCNCGGSFCGCCTLCCKGNCPKCYLCLAACCAPFLLCCAPLLLCLSRLFSCCGSSCRNCCCGSKSQRHGTEKAGEQKFVVRGIGDDKSAELARLQRELDMKNKYIQQMRGNELPAVRRMWTQTTEPVVLLSDTCDDDSDDDGNGNTDGKGNKKGHKKRKRFRVLNRKLDFSNVKSRTDSNYKNGKIVPMVKVGSTDKSVPDDKDGKKSGLEDNGNYPVVYVDAGKPTNNDADLARLKRLLAERDAEIERLKNQKGYRNGHDIPEVAEPLESDMNRGLGFPATDRNPQTVVIINPDAEKPKSDKNDDGKRKVTPGDEEDLDALIKELDSEETPRGGYKRNRNKFKIYQQKLDWSQIPSKLRAAGLIHQNAGSNDDKENVPGPGKMSKASPEQNSPAKASLSLEPQRSNPRYSSNKRLSNIKIFNEKIDYSKIRSKIRPLISNDQSRTSLSSSENGSLRILNHPSEYNKKARTTPSTSDTSLNKPDAPRTDSIRTLNEPKFKSSQNSNDAMMQSPPDRQPDKPANSVGAAPPDNASNSDKPSETSADKPSTSKPAQLPKSEVKVLNDPKDYSHVKSKLVPDPPPKPKPAVATEPEGNEKPSTSVRILNDPKDYSHVKSKLVPDPPPKPKPAVATEPEGNEKPSTSVRILNDPKDYSHVKSKLVPDPPPKPKPAVATEPEGNEKPCTSVRILNDPKDYSHVRSKLIPDPPPKPTADKPSSPKPAETPKSDVRIVNDPKDYSHVKSKLIPDPPSKANPSATGESSPRDKPSSNVKILNAPKDYSHVTSKLSTAGREPKKSTVRITNKPADYSHVRSKLV